VGLGGLHRVDAGSVDIEELFMTTEEALDLALRAFVRAERDGYWSRDTAIAVEAINQARSAPTVQPVVNASAWFALVMNAAAELEDASNCIRDEDAKRVANSGAKYYRDAANALHTTPPAAPVQEPVAWLYEAEYSSGSYSGSYFKWCVTANKFDTSGAREIKPLYTTLPAAQRQWVGLTDEDWKELHLTTNARTYGPAIEAKLKEKNT
jgi:hypothetical protein